MEGKTKTKKKKQHLVVKKGTINILANL